MDERDLVCAEFYAVLEPDRLLAAADLPKKTWGKGVQTIGKALCRAIGADAVNALILDGEGNPVERMIINR